MASISISRAWDETNAMIAREASLLVPVGLALIVVPGVLLDQLRPAAGSLAAARTAPDFTMLAGLLFSLFASLVLSLLALRPGISVAEALRGGIARFPVALGASLLLAAGFLLLLVPAFPLMAGGEAAVQRMNPAFALLLLVYLVGVIGCIVYAFPRLLLVNTVAATERLGVFATLARSWMMTRGRFARLAGFIALFLAINLIVTVTVLVAGGALFLGLGRLLGDPALGRLLTDLGGEIANAAFLTWLYLMLASLYRQIAAVLPAGSNSGI